MIDASVWVSYFLVRDSHHRASYDFVAGQLARRGILAGPGPVLAEVAGAVTRAVGDPAAGREALAVLLGPVPSGLGLEIVTWEPREEEAAAELACDLLLPGADAHYVLAAHRLSMPLVSWDGQKLARACALVPTGRPGEPLRRPEAR